MSTTTNGKLQNKSFFLLLLNSSISRLTNIVKHAHCFQEFANLKSVFDFKINAWGKDQKNPIPLCISNINMGFISADIGEEVSSE